MQLKGIKFCPVIEQCIPVIKKGGGHKSRYQLDREIELGVKPFQKEMDRQL